MFLSFLINPYNNYSFHSTRRQNNTFTWRLFTIYYLAMPIHLLLILRNFQSNLAMDFFSTSLQHVKLMQLMQTLLCTLIKLTCLRHGIELQTNTLQSMQTKFGEHAIGLEDQQPTIKLQNWLGLVVKLALLKPSLLLDVRSSWNDGNQQSFLIKSCKCLLLKHKLQLRSTRTGIRGLILCLTRQLMMVAPF